VTAEKRKAIEISYPDARSLVTFLGGRRGAGGAVYCDNRKRVFMFDYDTKEKNIKSLGNLINTRGATPPRTYQIASCFDALSITYFIIKHTKHAYVLS
jgi:hypothetical protein